MNYQNLNQLTRVSNFRSKFSPSAIYLSKMNRKSKAFHVNKFRTRGNAPRALRFCQFFAAPISGMIDQRAATSANAVRAEPDTEPLSLSALSSACARGCIGVAADDISLPAAPSQPPPYFTPATFAPRNSQPDPIFLSADGLINANDPVTWQTGKAGCLRDAARPALNSLPA